MEVKEPWSLQEEIERWGAQWYMLVLAILVGGALGWGAAWVFPAPAEARAPLFVAFNSDALFTSPDDYKNGQFEEVTDLLLSDALLDEVLTGLEGDWDRGPLRAGLSVEWRNAGRWELVARDQDPDRAARFAARWREVAFDHLSTALPHALTFLQLDQEMNLLSRQLADTARAQTRLDAVESAIRARQAQAGEPSATARAELWAYALEFSTPRGFPEEGAGAQAYEDWATELLAVLEVKRGLLDVENQTLQTRMESLKGEWEAEKAASRGLSAYLVVELRGDVETSAVRSPGLLALVGGMVGVLSWLVGWLVSRELEFRVRVGGLRSTRRKNG